MYKRQKLFDACRRSGFDAVIRDWDEGFDTYLGRKMCIRDRIDISDIGRYKPEQITIITTGSQGEPMSALYRMAFSDRCV